MDRLRKYILLFLYLISAFTYIKCDGEMAVVEKPSSMKLYGGNEMQSSAALDAFKGILGFHSEGVKQMELTNVFNLAGMKLIIIFVGDKKFDDLSSSALKKYKMKEDMLPEDMMSLLAKDIVGKNSFGMNVHFNQLKNTESVSKMDTNKDEPEVILADLRSMSEPEITKTMADLAKIKEGSSNVMSVVIKSDGKISVAYDREKRQTPPAADDSNDKKKEVVNAKTLNLADDYDENFPVIFNIMLWFSIALIFALISICMVIANMDPGRDSIIYRMTSTRMKKDN